jgi:hypothetical protein
MNGCERLPGHLPAVRRPWQRLELRIPEKLGTDGKFPVLGSATELPRIAAPGLGVLNVNYSESGQAP